MTMEEAAAKWWKWFEGTVGLLRGNGDSSDDSNAIKKDFAN